MPQYSPVDFIKRMRKSPLRIGDFRILCLSTLFNSIGFLGEIVVIGWVLLEITGSPFWVAVGAGLRTAPGFFVGLFAGGIADWIDRRTLLRLSNGALMLTAIAVGLMLTLDPISLWLLLPMTFVSGTFGAVQNIARQSYAFDLAGSGNVVASLSFVSIAMRVGGAIGALIAGFTFGPLGAEFAYAAVAISYAMSGLSLYFLKTHGDAAPTERSPVIENLKEFGRELKTNHTLLMLVVVVALIEMLGFSHLAVLPSFAQDVLDFGPEGLGILTAVSSVGGMIGILALSAFGDVPRKGYGMMIVTALFGAGLIFFGLSQSIFVALIAISVVSAAMALSDVLSQSIMQLVVGNRLRGRAMGAWVVAVGTAPVGNLQIGALATFVGVSYALSLNGAGLVLLAVLMLVLLKRLRQV